MEREQVDRLRRRHYCRGWDDAVGGASHEYTDERSPIAAPPDDGPTNTDDGPAVPGADAPIIEYDEPSRDDAARSADVHYYVSDTTMRRAGSVGSYDFADPTRQALKDNPGKRVFIELLGMQPSLEMCHFNRIGGSADRPSNVRLAVVGTDSSAGYRGVLAGLTEGTYGHVKELELFGVRLVNPYGRMSPLEWKGRGERLILDNVLVETDESSHPGGDVERPMAWDGAGISHGLFIGRKADYCFIRDYRAGSNARFEPQRLRNHGLYCREPGKLIVRNCPQFPAGNRTAAQITNRLMDAAPSGPILFEHVACSDHGQDWPTRDGGATWTFWGNPFHPTVLRDVSANRTKYAGLSFSDEPDTTDNYGAYFGHTTASGGHAHKEVYIDGLAVSQLGADRPAVMLSSIAGGWMDRLDIAGELWFDSEWAYRYGGAPLNGVIRRGRNVRVMGGEWTWDRGLNAARRLA
jgi:hypothetical protein